MDLDIIQYSFTITIAIFVALVTLIFYLSEKKLKPHPDYDNGIPVIEVVKELEKACPIGKESNWVLFPFDYGCHRCWSQSLSLPFLQNLINLYGSTAKINSSSEVICSLIADVTKWPEWNPFFTSQYIIKAFHDKPLRRDNFMEAERVISIMRETNKIQSHLIMYRFHHFSENKVGWTLLWNPKKLEFLYFLIQPAKDPKGDSVCLLTHIMGTESKLLSSSISLISQRLRNIQDFLTLSSLRIVPSLHSSQKEVTSEKKSHDLSSSSQECSSALSSAKSHKKEVSNTVFILVPFIQSMHQLWKRTVEYKLAVKNIVPASSQKNVSSAVSSKEKGSDSRAKPKPLRRTVSDVGMNPKALANLNECLLNTADNSKNSLVPKKTINSESKDLKNKNPKHMSESASEDSDNKNTTSHENLLQKTRLRSHSETVVNNPTNLKFSSKSVSSESDYDSFGKLEDVSEIPEDQLLALDDEDNKFHSSVSEDFEVVENYEFTENRIASFITQGNYGAAELQAEVLIASQFLHDMNSGNYQSIGGWMFHSYHKSLCVLKKVTCSQFLTISSFLCQTEIPVAPKDVWKIVKCPQFRFICDESVKSVEVIEKISKSQKLIHTYHEVSGFVKKELIDFCLLQTEREEVNKYYSCFSSIEYDKCPFVKNVTRGTLRPSGWIVEKVSDDPHKSTVTYVMQGFVSSPDSLFIQELGTMVPQSMHNLKNYITSKPM